MKREPQPNSTKERIIAWLKEVGRKMRKELNVFWQLVKKNVSRFWHRYQITRWLIVVFLSIFLIASIHLTFIAKTANVKNLQNRLSRPTMIYDNKKQSAGSLYSQKGTYVKLDKISANVPAAVLSTEDRNFYHEHGFSIKGLGRAAFLLVKNKLLHRDYISGGGSTLTQQLVKNAFLTQQQTFSRKAREIFIAVEVENQYSKNQILTMYLNNAYFGHGFRDTDDYLANIFDLCKKYGSEDMVYEFMSTSKVTFSGAGVAVFAASRNNIEFLTRQMNVQTLGYDKLNQLRHVKYFKNAEGLYEHMKKQADYLRPKFDCTLAMLEDGLGGLGIAEWTRPNGGYFVSFDGLPGTAKRCVSLCKEVGVKFTDAGATFPYGIDPEDKNIRIAPSFPAIDQLYRCMQVFCICQRAAALEVLLAQKD